MLQVKDKEQFRFVFELCQNERANNTPDSNGVSGYLTYEQMAQIIDYLRHCNSIEHKDFASEFHGDWSYCDERKKNNLDMSIVSPQMLMVVNEWLAYKKEKGQSYKPIGFKTFYKKLCEMSDCNPKIAMAIIEQSMQNNYSGIFPLRNNNNNNNYGRETISDKIKRTAEQATAFKQKLDEEIERQANMDVGDEENVWWLPET